MNVVEPCVQGSSGWMAEPCRGGNMCIGELDWGAEGRWRGCSDLERAGADRRKKATRQTCRMTAGLVG